MTPCPPPPPHYNKFSGLPPCTFFGGIILRICVFCTFRFSDIWQLQLSGKVAHLTWWERILHYLLINAPVNMKFQGGEGGQPPRTSDIEKNQCQKSHPRKKSLSESLGWKSYFSIIFNCQNLWGGVGRPEISVRNPSWGCKIPVKGAKSLSDAFIKDA